MNPLLRSGLKHSAVVGLVLVLLSVSGFESLAQTDFILESKELEELELTAGKSVLLRASEPVKRVSIANLEVADFNLLSAREIYITGKAPGTTNITLWHGKAGLQVYDLIVNSDVSRLKQRLHEILPDEQDIRVVSFDESVTLTGRVSSTANLSQALALAETYAPKKVRNLLEVTGVQQVMLDVRVSEMSRSLSRRLSVNWIYNNSDGEFGIGLLGQLAQLVKPDEANLAAGALSFLVSPNANALFRFNSGNGTHTGIIDALKEEGLIKILAEPNLIALSGETASFLAGGEFPVPIPQGLGTVAVEYKSFGVALSFTPTVLAEDKISMRVMPEVSELDFSTAVQFEGFVVPGLSTRRASTVIELNDGQSFAMAGLLKDTVRDVAAKYPGLGDLPILGNLFKSRDFQTNETELIIIVTPHLVKPLDMKKQTLPTDYYIAPNDVDFYFWGSQQGAAPKSPKKAKVQLDGDFGHTIPMTE
jgi:pilus assembly protein CpaC